MSHLDVLTKYEQLLNTYPPMVPSVYRENELRFQLIDEMFEIIREILAESPYETTTEYFVNTYHETFVEFFEDFMGENVDDVENNHRPQFNTRVYLISILFDQHTGFIKEFFEYCFENNYLDKTEECFKEHVALQLLTQSHLERIDRKQRVIYNLYQFDTYEYIAYEVLEPEFVAHYVDETYGTFLHHILESFISVPENVLLSALEFFDRHGYDYTTRWCQRGLLRTPLFHCEFDTIERLVRRGAVFDEQYRLNYQQIVERYDSIARGRREDTGIESMKFFRDLFSLLRERGEDLEYERRIFLQYFGNREDVVFCKPEDDQYYEACIQILG